MPFHSPTETRMARKQHRCTSCGEMIEPGEQYLRWVSIDDAPLTNKMHPECEAYHRLSAEGGEWEYMMYGHEKPTKEWL